jgi:hypothetical protein
MHKTVVCHFYNEEFLLPWWLQHHKHVFDHGIMIDYASTDGSCELIRKICPTWEILPSRNEFFDAKPIDDEVMDIESKLSGWRIALNVTEFLYGNTDHLDARLEPTQYFLTNYVFVDMEDNPNPLDHTRPLHEQRYWGYLDNKNNGDRMEKGSAHRMNRSIHNHPITYPNWGRHWPDTTASFDDLVIFYYGYGDASERGLDRKAQIRSRISEVVGQVTHTLPPGARFEEDGEGKVKIVDKNGIEIQFHNRPGGWGSHHNYNKEEFLLQYRHDQQPKCSDLRAEIADILQYNKQLTGQDF